MLVHDKYLYKSPSMGVYAHSRLLLTYEPILNYQNDISFALLCLFFSLWKSKFVFEIQSSKLHNTRLWKLMKLFCQIWCTTISQKWKKFNLNFVILQNKFILQAMKWNLEWIQKRTVGTTTMSLFLSEIEFFGLGQIIMNTFNNTTQKFFLTFFLIILIKPL